MALAQEHKCFFLECSAKTKENVQECFKDLTLKVSIFDPTFRIHMLQGFHLIMLHQSSNF